MKCGTKKSYRVPATCAVMCNNNQEWILSGVTNRSANSLSKGGLAVSCSFESIPYSFIYINASNLKEIL